MNSLTSSKAFIHHFQALVLTFALAHTKGFTADFPEAIEVETQPFSAQISRIIEASEFIGAPLDSDTKVKLRKAFTDTKTGPKTIQELLDPWCLVGVHINPESRVKVAPGPAKPLLIQEGWKAYLIKVHNEAGVTSELKIDSPNTRKLHGSPQEDVPNRWLEVDVFNKQPLTRTLSGLPVEYRIVQLYTRETGKRDAKLTFNVGQGTQDLGFRSDVSILFDIQASKPVTLHVFDEAGKPTTASFVFRDRQDHVFPAQGKRLAPDFSFHPQIYRAHKETIYLPDGEYSVEFSRGPESITRFRKIVVNDSNRTFDFKVERWIDPSKSGWWSGDHHIHAAGCAHYEKPTEGVHAPDMMRHCLGEDVKIGANLTWGPCFDYQKQFFTGKIDKVSQYPYLLRYDVEISGFGSHQSGHLVLLRLKEQMYPGGESKHHWPTLGLNSLRWAKKQGAVVGPAHSGWGLQVKTSELPNFEPAPFDGIGANEYIVDVTHQVPGPDGKLVPAVDFISTVDTPYVWELNIWYHTLNCGFRTRISGETDFPCIYGEKVGLGRSYVKLPGKLDYDDWCEGIRKGRNYVSDGKSHIMDFKIDRVEMGDQKSELRVSKSKEVTISAKVAARLDPQSTGEIRNRPYSEKPYWDIERARIEGTREVPVELIVNGYVAAKRKIVADGSLNNIDFKLNISKSSWVAIRILPSSHTNPIFVVVDDKPIRASRRSAEWCLASVDRLWSNKARFIHASEMEDAKSAYAHARDVYREIIVESSAE